MALRRRHIVGIVLLLTLIVMAPRPGVSRMAAEPSLVAEFLHNGFRQALQVDSFLVAAMDGGLGVLSLDSTADGAQFMLQNFYPLAESPRSLRRDGDTLVVRESAVRFGLYSLNQLPDLAPAGRFEYTNEILDYQLSSGVMFFAEEFKGVTSYRIGESDALIFQDSSMVPIKVTQLLVRPDTLFALDEYNGIMRFINPVNNLDSALDYMLLPFPATGVTSRDSSLVLANGDSGFVTTSYGASGLLAPLVEHTSVTYAYKVFESDSQFVVISSPNVIEVISKSDPGDSRFIPAEGNTQGAFLYSRGAGTFLVTPSRQFGLAAYELDVPTFPQLFAKYDHPGPVRSVEYSRGMFYTAGRENPLEKYDPLDPAGVALLGERSWPDGVSASAMIGDTLFLINGGDPVPLLWVALTSVDSLPRPLETFGAPADIEDLEVFPDPERNRKFFVMRSGSQHYINRAEAGELFGETTVAADLGAGVATVAVAQGRIYHYSTKGVFVVSLLSFFNNINEVAIIPVNYTVRDILPVNNQNRLLLFSPGIVRVMDISTPDRHEVLREFTIQGDYTSTRLVGDLVFAAGSASTGVLQVNNDEIREIAFAPVGAERVAGGDGLIFASDGGSVKMYEFLPTDVSGEPDDEPVKPQAFRLVKNYPNPFNGETTIEFSGRPFRENATSIKVYNVLGQVVREITLGPVELNSGSVNWDGRDQAGRSVASGVYFAQLSGAAFGKSLKMIYLK